MTSAAAVRGNRLEKHAESGRLARPPGGGPVETGGLSGSPRCVRVSVNARRPVSETVCGRVKGRRGTAGGHFPAASPLTLPPPNEPSCRSYRRSRGPWRAAGRPRPMRRAEVWWAELPPPVGPRPVVVLTRNAVSDAIGAVVVALVTRTSWRPSDRLMNTRSTMCVGDRSAEGNPRHRPRLPFRTMVSRSDLA
jgi:hypothetical protein